jgi:hypothetical protein
MKAVLLTLSFLTTFALHAQDSTQIAAAKDTVDFRDRFIAGDRL